MNQREEFSESVEKIRSGKYERMKSNCTDIIEHFQEHVTPNEFAEFICQTNIFSEEIFSQVHKKALNKLPEEKKEDSESIVFEALLLNFIRAMKDNRHLILFILDELEYPKIEVI